MQRLPACEQEPECHRATEHGDIEQTGFQVLSHQRCTLALESSEVPSLGLGVTGVFHQGEGPRDDVEQLILVLMPMSLAGPARDERKGSGPVRDEFVELRELAAAMRLRD